MARDQIQIFIRSAENDLASIRRALLIASNGDSAVLDVARQNLTRLQDRARESGLTEIAEIAGQCRTTLEMGPVSSHSSPNSALEALDLVARIEAAIWNIPLNTDDSLLDISGFVDASFGELMPGREMAEVANDESDSGFEIDEETLEIFRSEAHDLHANIVNAVTVLDQSPTDEKALWDLRRNSHTFKGAAGIVGLKEASEVAHRMEDLLDRLVETGHGADPQMIRFLRSSAERLDAIVSARSIDDDSIDLDEQFRSVINRVAGPTITDQHSPKTGSHNETVPSTEAVAKTASTPVVRVSLEKLDEIIGVSRQIFSNRTLIANEFVRICVVAGLQPDAIAGLSSLMATDRNLLEDIQSKLRHIRMVRFGTLETRLRRAVNVTCGDENKKATIEVENPEVEIDTQLIDALIEPLLHLLKNAVVHGIEPPETRRLIGKPESGRIRVRLDADDEALILSIEDDGGGISIPKLKERAIASGRFDIETVAAMDDHQATNLIFDRGLTTADKIDLNAGRGIGMGIVKESVESHGGTVFAESVPQRGTTITILMPISRGPNEIEPEPPNFLPVETAGAKPLILVVDDSPSILRHTVRLVEESGYSVISAVNGAEAVKILLSGSAIPNAILSDVEMPEMDGWEFLEFVKGSSDLEHIPLVMVTSLDADEHRSRAFGLGASDYLVKPFSGNDLSRILGTVLEPMTVQR